MRTATTSSPPSSPTQQQRPKKYTPYTERSNATFTDCYCEENVWLCCRDLDLSSADPNSAWYAIMMTSEDNVIPMWNQAAEDSLSFWDYHVILVHLMRDGEEDAVQSYAYDLASKVDAWGMPFEEYIKHSFLQSFLLDGVSERLLQLHRDSRFKVIDAKSYYENFSSDRSHMVKDGAWLSPPPSYPCIIQPDNITKESMNLPLYREVRKDKEDAALGEIMDLRELCRFFGMKEVDQILTDKRWMVDKTSASILDEDDDEDDNHGEAYCAVDNTS